MNTSKKNRGYTRHGKTYTKTYRRWSAMLQRCNSPKSPVWKAYGGRGISVCKEWLRFDAFLKDMGEVPEGCVLDRINNNGNYEPGNCRWVDRCVNDRNKQDTVYMTVGGETKSLMDWAELTGNSRDKLYNRYRRLGWSAEDSISMPYMRGKSYAKYSA